MNKRLYRSRKEKMIGGVCGGLAEYFDIDPVFVRILFVVAVFAGGSGILAYIICWIIIPEQPYTAAPATPAPPSTQPDSTQPAPAPPSSEHKGSASAGIILIIIGGLFLANNFLPRFHFGDLWPLILILLGIAILSRTSRPA
jgi:phage shock protein C